MFTELVQFVSCKSIFFGSYDAQVVFIAQTIVQNKTKQNKTLSQILITYVLN